MDVDKAEGNQTGDVLLFIGGQLFDLGDGEAVARLLFLVLLIHRNAWFICFRCHAKERITHIIVELWGAYIVHRPLDNRNGRGRHEFVVIIVVCDGPSQLGEGHLGVRQRRQ